MICLAILREFQIELVHFHQLPALGRKENVFEWYRSKKTDFPKLAAVARILLCIPCSSVDSERLFSQATHLYSNKLRNRLGGERAQQVLLIKSSLKNLELGPALDNDTDDEIELELSDTDA